MPRKLSFVNPYRATGVVFQLDAAAYIFQTRNMKQDTILTQKST